MNANNVLGVVGSPRSKCNERQLKETILQIKDEHMLNMAIEKMARDQSLSNTEICLMASLFSVKSSGLDFEILNLKNYFNGSSFVKSNRLEKLVDSANGIIIASPVYFGDMSTLISSFIGFMKRKSLLKGRIIGCISAGAKRNGGQETTNVFVLKEVNDAGAYVVGNGPPTSQYGGTAWAGDIGTIREDEFGISTSIGTGRKVAEVISLLSCANKTANTPLKISFWIVKDSRNRLQDELKKIMEYADKNTKIKIKWDIIEFIPMDIQACQACNRCPWYQDKKDLYKCKIKKDDFASIYDRLVNADAVFVCGYTPASSENVKDVYHKVLERTRTIRRDNFMLSNVPIAPISLEEFPGNPLFPLKVMTSFLRHNTVICPPVSVYLNNKEQTTNIENVILDFIGFTMRIKNGKKASQSKDAPQYLPIGYSS